MTAKRLEFFLTSKDEASLMEQLAPFPWFTLLEEKGATMQVAESSSNAIQWWITTLPFDRTEIGTPEFPPLIQFLRSQVSESTQIPGKMELRQGRVAIDYDTSDAAAKDAVTKVWKAIKSLTTSDIVRIDPLSGNVYGKERNVFIGADAARWQQSGNLLSGNGAGVFFSPVSHR